MEFNNDFKHDLKVGQSAENKLAKILEDSTIEVKYDLKAWQTGNVFIEFESRGKPSGLARSEASHYAFALEKGPIIIIETFKLKNICRKYLGTSREIRGGDSNTSVGILLPVIKLLTYG